MSRLLPIACLALLGTAGAQALADDQVAQTGAPAQQTQAAPDSAAQQTQPATDGANPALKAGAQPAASQPDSKPGAQSQRRRDQKPAQKPAEGKDVQEVNVTGSRDMDVRRASTAA
jgi:hypothetical protein